jgi:hypothetical protein
VALSIVHEFRHQRIFDKGERGFFAGLNKQDEEVLAAKAQISFLLRLQKEGWDVTESIQGIRSSIEQGRLIASRIEYAEASLESMKNNGGRRFATLVYGGAVSIVRLIHNSKNKCS